MAGQTPEVLEFLLNCQICLEPFDQTLCIPRILPCHHTFCSPCIAKLDRGGVLTCPNDRGEIDVSGPFPVDFTRASVVEHKNVLLRKGRASSPLEEVCQKHQDKKLEFFCSTCKSALCSECAVIEHKNQVGHDIVRLGDVLEQVKGEIESRSKELDNIRQSSLQPRAKMAATSLQETDASFQDAAKELQEGFGRLVTAIHDRQEQAMEELRSKWKADRLTMEDQAAVTESQVNAAKTCTALGRTVSSMGLPGHIVAQRQELERAVQEARAEGGKTLLPSMQYKVNFDTSRVMDVLPHLGTIQSVPSAKQSAPAASAVTSPRQPALTTSAVTSPRQPAPTTSTVTSPSQPAPTTSGATSPRQPALAASSLTSSTIQTPQFQLEPGRCNAGCTLEEDGRPLTNTPRPQSGGTGQSGPRPFAFPGTCGSVDLAQPALHYWTVRLRMYKYGTGERFEIGLASLQSLQTCGSGKRISDHDIQAPTIVMVVKEKSCRLEGRGWTKDVDTPPPPVTSDTPYTCLERRSYDFGLFGFSMTLGFLYDNRQPQSPRVVVVDAESCRLLGVRRLSPSPDLRPVLRVWPSRNYDNGCNVKLEVRTGPGVLDDVTMGLLQSVLGWMERKNKKGKDKWVSSVKSGY